MDREERFSTSLQPALKLDIALERLLDKKEGAQNLTPEWEETYRGYLAQRAYPALLRLVQWGDARRLRRFLKMGLADPGQCRQALEQAGAQKTEIRLLLMGIPEPPEDPGLSPKDPLTKESAALQAWALTGESLAQEIPYLYLFFADLEAEPASVSGSISDAGPRASGTDGLRIFLHVDQVLGYFREGLLRELYLHIMIHILYGHLLPDPRYPRALWELACDVAAWHLWERAFGLPLSVNSVREETARLRGIFPDRLPQEDPGAVCGYLREHPEERSAAACILKALPGDSHDHWYQREAHPARAAWDAQGPGGGPGAGDPGRAEYLRRLERKFAQARAIRAKAEEDGRLKIPRVRRFGLAPGSRRERLELQKQQRYDLRRYLRRFAFVREELQTDEESFDYIYYTLGLARYGNMPLIEPLEYMEAQRVEELVIAIDTSGSCSLALVRRFLEVTRDMLTRREDFFRRMNVHIIQCDLMIQQHQVIASVEDWKRYEKELTIEGRGGTDFTPVFRFVERLRREGALKKLKGLLYFTDGDGIYPRQPTDYETAFVFADRACLNGEQAGLVPGWAVKLCMEGAEEG